MKGKFLFWLLLVAIAVHFVVSHSAHAQNNLVGKVAPELSIENFLQTHEGKMSWDKLKGKVVILVFWATWCDPYIAQIPHLNKLAEDFSNEPVQFISISDEDELNVARFLNKREMKSWIGLDKDRSVFNLYGVFAIPTTFVVDPQGEIATVLHPKTLNAQMIAGLIAGKEPIEDRPVESKYTPIEADHTELEIVGYDGKSMLLSDPSIAYPSGMGPSRTTEGIEVRRGIEEVTLLWSRVRMLDFRSRQEKNDEGTIVWRHSVKATLANSRVVDVELEEDWNMAYMGGGGTGLLFGQSDLGETRIPFSKISVLKVLKYINVGE